MTERIHKYGRQMIVIGAEKGTCPPCPHVSIAWALNDAHHYYVTVRGEGMPPSFLISADELRALAEWALMNVEPKAVLK